MASRHRSREVALQALYALDLAGLRRDGSTSAQEVFDHVAASFEVPEGCPFQMLQLSARTSAGLGDIAFVVDSPEISKR